MSGLHIYQIILFKKMSVLQLLYNPFKKEKMSASKLLYNPIYKINMSAV